MKQKKKNKENEIMCDYCDKKFDVRTFDTTKFQVKILTIIEDKLGLSCAKLKSSWK